MVILAIMHHIGIWIRPIERVESTLGTAGTSPNKLQKLIKLWHVEVGGLWLNSCGYGVLMWCNHTFTMVFGEDNENSMSLKEEGCECHNRNI